MTMSRCLRVLLVLVLFAGCGGPSRSALTPASESLVQSLLRESPARFLQDVTLDETSTIERAYRYGETRPGQERVFEVHASELAASQMHWTALEGQFAGLSTANGHRVVWTAPTVEGEARIDLEVATPDGIVRRQYRLYVTERPISNDHPIPAPLKLVDLPNPHATSPWDATIPCVDDELLLQVRPGTPTADLPRVFDALDLQILFAYPHRPAYLLRNAAGGDLLARLAMLRALPFVEHAEPNLIYQPTDIIPDDPYYPEQYAPALQHLPEAWELEQGSDEQLLAIMDTGISRTHPDLVPNVVDGADFISPPGDGLGGETLGDGIDNDGRRGPDHAVGHGTGCAGIAGARGNNAIGVAGVSWHTKLLPLRIAQAHGDAMYTLAGVVAAHDYITAWNEDPTQTRTIVACNMSFGGYVPSPLHQEAIARAAATGVTYVGGTGNDNANALFYPAAYDHVIAASAVGEGDVFAFFSNYGPWIDVSSAGHLIRTTWYEGPPGNPNPDAYTINSGTSFAAPEVVGLVGLLKARYPELTPDQVTAQILRTADNIDAVNPDYVGMMGAGRINALRALTEGIEADLSADGSYLLEDGEALFADGNRDGIANPGERVLVLPVVRNAGIQDALDLRLTVLSAPDPRVRVLEPSVTIPRISTLDGIVGWAGLPLVIHPSTPDQYTADLDCRLTDPTGLLPPLDFTLALTIQRDAGFSDTVQSSATGLLPSTLDRPTTAQPIFRIDLTGDREYTTIEALTLHLTGTCPPSAVANLGLWRDSGDGEFSLGEEEELAAASYWNDSFASDYDRQSDPAAGVGPVRTRDPNADGALTGPQFTFADVRLAFPDNQRVTLFVTCDLLEIAPIGSTLGFEVRDQSDFVLSAGDLIEGLPWESGETILQEAWGPSALVGVGSARLYDGRAAFKADGTGYFVCYGDQFGDYDVFFMGSADGGATWTPTGRFSITDDDDAAPEVAVSPSGRAHIIWYGIHAGSADLFHSASTDGGGTWTAEARITDPAAGDNYLPHLALIDEMVHLVWVGDAGNPGTFSVRYASSTDGGASWTPPQNLSQTTTGRVALYPRLAAAGADLYLTWFDGQGQLGGSIVDPRVRAMFRPDGGVWSAPRALTPAGELAAYPAIVAGGVGDAWVAYESDAGGASNIWLQHLESAITSTTAQVTDLPGGCHRPALSRTATGRLDLAYEVQEPAGMAIWHQYRTLDPSPWTGPLPVSRPGGGEATAPSLALSPDGQHLSCYWNDTRAVSPQVWGAALYVP